MNTKIEKLKKVKRLLDFQQDPAFVLKELDEIQEKIDLAKGDKGEQGIQGEQGPQGDPGRDGIDGINGTNGLDGKDGLEGPVGAQGVPGNDGSPDTPNQIAEKLNTLEEVIDKKVIKGLLKTEDIIKELKKGKQLEMKEGMPLNMADLRYHGGGLSSIIAGSGITAVDDGSGHITVSAPGSTTDEKVKYDAGDPTAGYVTDKFVAGTGITLSEGTGGDENKLKITATATPTAWVSLTGTPTALLLDQTTPQSVTGGAPTFSAGLNSTYGVFSSYLSSKNFTTSAHYTGFPNRTDTTLSWDDGTATLTLTAVNKTIWINGVEYTINTLTKAFTSGLAEASGTYWFYITAPGGVPQLNYAATVADQFGQCLVAEVYWNTTTNAGILGDERHWMGRDKWMHEYLHETVGARYYVGLTGTFANTTISITAGEFYDEDIEHLLSSDTPMAYPGTAMTRCKVIYHNGDADWKWDTNQTTPYKIVTGNLQYNSGNTLTPADSNKYVNYFVFATNSTVYPIHIIIGTAQYNTLADAVAAAIPSLGAFESAEVKLLYKITYRNDGPTYQNAIDYRTSSSLAVNNFVPTSHASLTNLSYATSGHTGFEPSLTKYNLTGTTNQVSLSGSGTGVLLARDIQLSLPQDIATTSSPQFANLILTGGGNIYPSADSTTALGIASFAAPTVKLFSFDSTNKGFLMTDAVNLTAGQAGTTLSLARSVSGDYTAIAITNSNGLDAGISFNHTNGWGTITTAMSGIRSTRTNRVSSTDTDIGFMTNSGFVRAVRFKVRDDGMIYMIGGKGIYPSADSTTAWGVYKADATTNVMNIDTNNARVGIGTTAPVSLLTLLGGSNITPSADSTTALGIASFAAPTTKWVTFDTTNKRLGIGKTPLYQLEIGIGNDYATQAISCFSDTVAHNPYLTFIKSRNDTVGTLTETIDTDVIGSLLATGVNSSSTVATGAGIKFVQAGAAGATYVPIDISFQTGTNAAARTERMKIDNAGNITVGTASTNTMTMTARFIPRTTASDPQHVTAGSRPAGTVGEIAYYNGKWYGCTNAATPLWEKITSL
jgi:hypothetical protein